MKLKKFTSKILIMIMIILSFLYVPTVHAETPTPNLTVTNKTLWINGKVNININNKVSGSKYTWTTSDSSIATVNHRGIVTGLKSGQVEVNCTITTKDKTYKLISHITISISKVIVNNQEQLEEALGNKDINKIMLKTSKDDTFIIPEKDYSDKRLYIKAPLSEINNNGNFKSVHTYVSVQAQLNSALKDPKITIVTIDTDEYKDFIINGDYPSVRLIVNAPNTNVFITGQLRNVDVNEVNTIKLPEEETDESSSDVTTPIPTPVVDEQPSEPSQPVVTPTPTPVTPTSTPTPTPVPPTTTPAPVDLATLKQNSINDINYQASVLYPTLTASEKTDLENFINNIIDEINNATSETMVSVFYAIAIDKIQNYGEETTNYAKIDYEAYLAGNMTLQELYTKYGLTTDGYTYTIPDNGVFYFDAGSLMVYIDYQNNKTFIFSYEKAYFETEGLTLDAFKADVLDKISTNNYLDIATGQFSGCIVSYHSTDKELAIFDPMDYSTLFYTITVTSVTHWTGDDGKKYCGYTGDSSSLNYIFTDQGVSPSISVSGSAISVDLYMNNTTEINRIVIDGINDILDTNYYSIDYNADNTAIIVFNEDFYNDYFMSKESGYQLVLIIYPTVTTNYGTELTLILN